MINVDPAVVAAVGSFITLLSLIGGGFFWLGKLSNRVGQLENRVDQVVVEMRDMREEMSRQGAELREEMARQGAELREEIARLREEMSRQGAEAREEMARQRSELLEEMRRGNQQLLLALVNHSHDGGGQPIFRLPVNPE